MRRGKRTEPEDPDEAAQAAAEADAAGESWTAADERAATADPEAAAVVEDEAVVEGEAVELTGAASAPEPAARPVPPTVEQSDARPDPLPPSASPIVDVSDGPSLTAPSYDGHAAPPPADPLEPVKALAAERPELVVGAAFAGGVLAAMILRRLGN